MENHINISRLFEVIYNPEADKFIYLIMELGDLNTIMLRDDDFNYRHNKKLIMHLFSKYKDTLFSDCESENNLFNTQEQDKANPLISLGNLKFPIKKKIAKILFSQIATGLLFLHNSLISHRDLKPDNIVFSSKDDNCKIIDFSISVFYKNKFHTKENKFDLKNIKDNCFTNEPGGSVHFQAPEQFESGKHNPFIADIWSLGITLYLFVFEEFPFDSDSELELQINICEGKPAFPEYSDDEMKSLIRKMMEKDVKKRIDLEEFILILSKI